MLIGYSVSSFEVLQRKLTDTEKDEIFNVFYRLGLRMGLKDLPANYSEWLIAHELHLHQDTISSEFTVDLYKQYRKHLGYFRLQLLKQVQVLIAPKRVKQLLSLGSIPYLLALLYLYKSVRIFGLDDFIIAAVLPSKYKTKVKSLNLYNT